jgi:endonuclease/exonuclease/phosphatase family metal-dependent hydrolase
MCCLGGRCRCVPTLSQSAFFRSSEDGEKHFLGVRLCEQGDCRARLCISVGIPADCGIELVAESGAAVAVEDTVHEGRYECRVVRQSESKCVSDHGLLCHRLGAVLGLPFLCFAPAQQPTFGNALLSRWPLSCADAVVADAAVEGGGVLGSRSAALATVQLPGGVALRIGSIHLDHRLEPCRMKQLRIFLPGFESAGQPVLLAGDFNALTRADYSQRHWDAIAQVRKKGNWEAPVSDATALLADAGWQDARSHAEWGRGADRVSTCRFGTRIDYCFFCPGFPGDISQHVYSVVDSEASDHSVVVLDLREDALS